MEKRFKEFHALNERLRAKNYIDLPKLPQKTFLPVRNHDQLEKRRQELTLYLRELVNRRDTRNSKEVIKFLHLDKFAPELLIFKPKVIEMFEVGGFKGYANANGP